MACGLIGNAAAGLVNSGWDTWRNFAEDAADDVSDFLNQLQAVNLTPVPLNVAYSIPPNLGAPFAKPTVPTAPDTSFSIGAVPTAPGLGSPVLPTFSVAPTDASIPPVIVIPAAPSPFTKELTETAPSVSDVTLPTEPVLVFPDDPTQQTIVIPAVPVTTIPLFTATAPIVDFAVPGETFSFVEELYTSNLLTDVTTKVTEWLAGGTGLPDAIWNQLWDRGRQNENNTGAKLIDEAISEWAARGFSMPPGALDAKVFEARQGVQDADNTFNREIVIKQAEMEVDNIRFAVGQALALEDTLISAHLQVQARKLQAAETAFRIGIEIFNAQVSLFNARNQAYATEAQVFRSKIEAEGLLLENYKSELEGQRIVSEINRQEVEIFTAKLGALTTQVEIFKAQLDGVQTQVEVDKTRIEAFRAVVQAFGEEVKAKSLEFDSYGKQIQGELSKAQVYDTQIKAFSGRIQAYATDTQAKVSQANLGFDAEKLKLQKFSAQIGGFSAELDAELKRVQATTSIFEGHTRIFQAELGAEQARIASDDRQFNTAVASATTGAELAIKQAQVNIQQLQHITELEQENLITASNVQSSLAAAAMSAVNLSAGVSESASNSSACTTSF